MGGIFGGFKLCRCAASLPLAVSVEAIAPRGIEEAFHRRVWLVYTGQQRLARNTLINALRYRALSPGEFPHPLGLTSASGTASGTVSALINGAQDGWALLNDADLFNNADKQLDCLSDVLNRCAFHFFYFLITFYTLFVNFW